jgi:hypothetical protein
LNPEDEGFSSKTVVTIHQTALHHMPETHSLKKIYPTNITSFKPIFLEDKL